MYSTSDPVGLPEIPSGATFWMPPPLTADELVDADEEYPPGIASFHDSWRITDASLEAARMYLDEELRLAEAVAALARNDDHFDELISIVEGGWVSSPDEALAPQEREILSRLVWDVPPDLAGLELGVAGLSYALNAVGIVTAASCRGHMSATAWSPAPVVAFAANRARAVELERLAVRTGCTFFIDDVRPELIVVAGGSIRDTIELAGLVISASHEFRAL